MYSVALIININNICKTVLCYTFVFWNPLNMCGRLVVVLSQTIFYSQYFKMINIDINCILTSFDLLQHENRSIIYIYTSNLRPAFMGYKRYFLIFHYDTFADELRKNTIIVLQLVLYILICDRFYRVLMRKINLITNSQNSHTLLISSCAKKCTF